MKIHLLLPEAMNGAIKTSSTGDTKNGILKEKGQVPEIM